MSLFRNKRMTNFLVTAFILVLLGFLAYEVRADTTTFEGGVTLLNTNNSGGESIMISERWNDTWAVGIGLIGEQKDKYDRNIDNNMLLYGQRLVYGPGWLSELGLGFGISYLNNTTTVTGTHLNYMLSVEYGYQDWYLIYRHMSNAGSRAPNTGQDLLSVGYKF